MSSLGTSLQPCAGVGLGPLVSKTYSAIGSFPLTLLYMDAERDTCAGKSEHWGRTRTIGQCSSTSYPSGGVYSNLGKAGVSESALPCCLSFRLTSEPRICVHTHDEIPNVLPK